MSLHWYLCEGTPSTTATSALMTSTPPGLTALTVSPGSGGTAQFSSTYTHSGVTSLQIFTPATVSSVVRLPFAAPHRSGAVSLMHRVATALPAALVILSMRHSSGQLFRIAVAANGAVLVQTSTGTTVVTTAAGAWEADRQNRIEFTYTIGTTTSDGEVSLSVYAGNDDVPTGTASTTTGNLGTADVVTLEVGAIPATSSFTSGVTQYFDSIGMDDGATAEIGPYLAANQPPAVTSLTAPQVVAASASFSATVVASDPEGGGLTYAWSVGDPSASAAGPLTAALTNTTSATVNGTAPATPGVVTLQCVITDEDDGETTVTTEIRVPRTSGDLLPLAIDGATSGGVWGRSGAATTDGEALGDELDTTYTISPEFAGTESWEEIRLEPTIARSALSIQLRTRVTATGGSAFARLMDGEEMRQQWTLSQSTSFTDQTLVVTNPGAISTWGALRVQLAVVS